MREGHIDRDARFSGLSLDATECDHFLAGGNELFCDEANFESSVKAGEKTLKHVLEALEMAAADGHPLRQVVDNMRRLKTSQRLATSRDGGFVESADKHLVFFFIA